MATDVRPRPAGPRRGANRSRVHRPMGGDARERRAPSRLRGLRPAQDRPRRSIAGGQLSGRRDPRVLANRGKAGMDRARGPGAAAAPRTSARRPGERLARRAGAERPDRRGRLRGDRERGRARSRRRRRRGAPPARSRSPAETAPEGRRDQDLRPSSSRRHRSMPLGRLATASRFTCEP